MWARVLGRRSGRGSGGGGCGEGGEEKWHTTGGGGGGVAGFGPDSGRAGQHPPLVVAGSSAGWVATAPVD